MKTVLYACTDLAYDQIFSPVVGTPGIEPVLFSARKPRFVAGWRWRPLPAEVAGLSPSLANRFCKFFPETIFPEAEVSIYVDANTLILADLRPLLDEFIASEADIGLFPHQERFDIFEEFEFCKRVNKIPPADHAKGQAQLRHYADEGLPRDHVFTENAILFRRHGNPALAAAMALWWEQLERFTKRDQLSLPYVLHKSDLKVKLWDWNYKFENPYFKRYMHRRGFFDDLNVFLKNKRHYNPVYRASIDGAFFVFHDMIKPLALRIRG